MVLFAALVVCMSSLISAALTDLEILDLTHVFDENTYSWPGHRKFELHVTINQTFPEGYRLQVEEFISGTHAGTHLGAPRHFHPDKWSVDQVPVDRLIAPAAVIDITQRAQENPDATVQVQDLKKWERITGQTLDNTIVLIRSGWSHRWSDRLAFLGTTGNDTTKFHFPGMSEEGAQWLVDNRNIYGVAKETFSLDSGNSTTLPANRILFGANIYGLLCVANVDRLPIYGATLYVSPMKIAKASGAPVRIIATFPKTS